MLTSQRNYLMEKDCLYRVSILREKGISDPRIRDGFFSVLTFRKNNRKMVDRLC